MPPSSPTSPLPLLKLWNGNGQSTMYLLLYVQFVMMGEKIFLG